MTELLVVLAHHLPEGISQDPLFHGLPQSYVGHCPDWHPQLDSCDWACEQALSHTLAQVALLKAADTGKSQTSLRVVLTLQP